MTKVRLKDGIRVNLGNFPADLLIETSSFHCRGLRFHPWSGNKDPTNLFLRPKQINKQTKKTTKELIKGNRGKEVWLGRAFGNAHRSVGAWLAGEIQRIP